MGYQLSGGATWKECDFPHSANQKNKECIYSGPQHFSLSEVLQPLGSRFLHPIFYHFTASKEKRSGSDLFWSEFLNIFGSLVSKSSRADNSSNTPMKSDQTHLRGTRRVHRRVWEQWKPHAQKERRRQTRKWIKPSYLAPQGVQLSQWPSEWSGTPATPVSITVWRE